MAKSRVNLTADEIKNQAVSESQAGRTRGERTVDEHGVERFQAARIPGVPVVAEDPDRLCGVCNRPASAHGNETHAFQAAPVVLDVAKGIVPEKAPETLIACVRREAGEMSALIAAGNAVSQSELIRLVHQAVGLLPVTPVASPGPDYPSNPGERRPQDHPDHRPADPLRRDGREPFLTDPPVRDPNRV